jgi:RNA polymerase sigma-70 factor (ECF subfamily)
MTGDTFEALLAPTLQSVRRLVQTHLRTPDRTDDIIQRTLLNAFTHRHQLRASSKFKSWLCSIAMNEVRMFFRTDRGSLSLDEFPSFDFRDSGPSPLARVEQLERLEWLQAGMAKLSERDRAAIRLRDFDGLTLTETAEAFASSEAAVKSTHFRARRRLACAVRSAQGTLRVEGRRVGEFAARSERKPERGRPGRAKSASILRTSGRVGQ